MWNFFFFQAEDGIRDLVRSRGLGDVYKRQGELRCLEVRGRNLLAHPAVRALILNISDITERQQAARALRASEERYRSLFEESRDAIYISTPAGEMLDLNPAGVRLFGFASREEALTASAYDLYWEPSGRERFAALMREQGFVEELESDLRTVDGDRRRVLETASAVLDGEGQVVAYRGTLRDVTVQRALEEQLRQARERLEEKVKERTSELHSANARLQQMMEERRELEKKLLEISERERRFIGRELHDGLSQQIVGVMCMFEAIRYRLEQHRINEEAELRMMRDYPRDALVAAVEDASRYGLYDLDRVERMVLRRIARDYFLLDDWKGNT